MAAKSYEKLVDDIGKLSVIELAELVKALEETFGVSAAMPVAAAQSEGSSAAPAQAEEKAEYKVTLQETGAEKIKVIKALKQVIPNLSLPDAKKAAEEAPTVIAEAVSKEDAQKMKKELEAAGAKVVLS
ncbi:MAG: 50S ribosomal protein L7/L12 [bacterium]|nr:50S ribosomal protein L7/L12 [bacterium]